MAPDYNLIQRPEVIRRLSRFFGLRQHHITPSLNEGVQPVVLVADLTREGELEETERRLVRHGSTDSRIAGLGLHVQFRAYNRSHERPAGAIFPRPFYVRRIHVAATLASTFLIGAEAGLQTATPSNVVIMPMDLRLAAPIIIDYTAAFWMVGEAADEPAGSYLLRLAVPANGYAAVSFEPGTFVVAPDMAVVVWNENPGQEARISYELDLLRTPVG